MGMKEKVTPEELKNIQVVGDLPECLKHGSGESPEYTYEQMKVDAEAWAKPLNDR
jgi:hypothetical protein